MTQISIFEEYAYTSIWRKHHSHQHTPCGDQMQQGNIKSSHHSLPSVQIVHVNTGKCVYLPATHTLTIVNTIVNCASSSLQGGWWYKSCQYSNLNGRYRYGTSSWGTMYWHPLAHGKQNAMKFTEMKLRPRD